MHRVSHRKDCRKNSYCGPAAISAITGCSAEYAAALIEAHRIKKQKTGVRSKRKHNIVRGVYDFELYAALTKLGVTYRISMPNCTVNAFTKNMKKDDIYIVTVPGHYIALEKTGYIDSHYNNGRRADAIGRRHVCRAVKILSVPTKKLVESMESMWPEAPKRPVDDLQQKRKVSKNYRRERFFYSKDMKGKEYIIHVHRTSDGHWIAEAPRGFHFACNGLHCVVDTSLRAVCSDTKFLEKCTEDCE